MNDLERKIAQMLHEYVENTIENDAYGMAVTIARDLADIFDNHAANTGEIFDKSFFLEACATN